MGVEKKLTGLTWHCDLDAKQAFQSLAGIEGLTASELLNRLASEYLHRRIDEAKMVLSAVDGYGTVGTVGTIGNRKAE